MYLFNVGNNDSPYDARFCGWCETMISGQRVINQRSVAPSATFFETVQGVATCNNGKAFPFTIHNHITRWDRTNRRQALISLNEKTINRTRTLK